MTLLTKRHIKYVVHTFVVMRRIIGGFLPVHLFDLVVCWVAVMLILIFLHELRNTRRHESKQIR